MLMVCSSCPLASAYAVPGGTFFPMEDSSSMRRVLEFQKLKKKCEKGDIFLTAYDYTY